MANAPAPQIVDSRLDAVTVFRRGALITRILELPVSSADNQRLRVVGLPLAAADDSFRARIQGQANGGPSVRDLRVVLEVPLGTRAERDDDERELEAARAEVARLESRWEQIGRERERLEKLELVKRPRTREGVPVAGSPTGPRLALLELRAKHLAALADEAASLDSALQAATERLARAEDEERRRSSQRRVPPHALRKSAWLHVDGAVAAPTRIALEYLVPGAAWAPTYTLQLDTGGSAEIAMRAHVSQRTGEDWEDVVLALSTAEPQRFVDLPELSSLRIGRAQHTPPALGWRPPPEGAEALYIDWQKAFSGLKPAEPEVPADFETPEAGHEAPEDEVLMAGLSEAVLEEAAEAELPAPPMAAAMPAAAAMDLDADGAPEVAPTGALFSRRKALARRGPPRPEPEEAPLHASRRLLDYGSLEMPPPTSSERGRLVIRERFRVRVDIEDETEIWLDAGPALDSARRRANSAGKRLPPGCELVSPEDGLHYAWPSPTRVDIPSDRRSHAVPVASGHARATLSHVVVPREALEAFRVVDLVSELPGPLLAGPVDVTLDGEFLLTARVPASPAGASIELGLGVEDGIRVARNTSFREEARGLTRGSLDLHHDIRIELRNTLERAASVEVRERVPVTREDDDDVSVVIDKVEPAWEPWDGPPGDDRLRGGHRWVLELQAGEKRGLEASYRVQIAAKHEVAGGNRREA